MKLTNMRKRLKAVNSVIKTDSYQEQINKYNLIVQLYKIADARRAKLMRDRRDGAAMMTESISASIDKLMMQYEAKKRKKRGNNQVNV